MKKLNLKIAFMAIMLFFFGGIFLIAQSPADKTIVLLSDPAHGFDDAQYAWLMDNGFNVDRLNIADDIDLTAPTQEVIDQLNAADLVIMGRDAYTNLYDGTGQDVIDNIMAPVLSNNAYGVQWGAPQMWFTNGVNVDLAAKRVWIHVDIADPIFANCNIQGDSISFSEGFLGTMQTSDPHNGTVIGSVTGDLLAIVRFAKDVPYNIDAGSKTPKSDRTVFSYQTGDNSFSLTHDGQAAYYAEICNMTGLPITEPAVYAGNPNTRSIVLLSDPAHGYDDAQYAWLMANGFNVERLNIADDIDMTAPSQEVIDQLNAADLVIMGRDAYTNLYDGIGQDVIDAITAPVMSNNAYGVQWGSPQMWFTNGVNTETSADQIWIQVSDDPIFANSNADGDSIYFCNGFLGAMQTPDAHNGVVVGSKTGDQMVIVRFAKDVPYNTSVDSKTPSSDRSVFSFQTGVKSFNLTEDGQAAYYGEIRRLLGYSIEAPVSYYVNPSSVATLSSLTASAGTLDPSFGPDVTFYTLEVPAGTASLDLTATATDANAIVDGAGTVSSIPSTVTITVTAENGVSTTDYVVDIMLEGTGINDFESAGIRMYPNPASQLITIDGLTAGSGVSVLAITGQLILRSNVTGTSLVLDLEQFKSGMYVIKIDLENESYFSRFVKR